MMMHLLDLSPLYLLIKHMRVNKINSALKSFCALLVLGVLNFDAFAGNDFKTTYDINPIGVFTRYNEFLWCHAKGGDWRKDFPGEWGTYYCYGPFSVVLTDENIASRAVVGVASGESSARCGSTSISSDTGWTLDRITIPPELNEYFTHVDGVWTAALKTWNRLILVDTMHDGGNPSNGCIYRSSFWWLATKTIERVKETCGREVGNPIRLNLGEKVQAIDLSGHLGFGFSFKYSSATRPVLMGGTGVWAHPADAELRIFGLIGSNQFKVVQGHELGAELRFDRVGQEWAKAQKTDASLADVDGASVLVLPEHGKVYKFIGSELRQKVRLNGGGLIFEYGSPADLDGNQMPRKMLSVADIATGRTASLKYKWMFSSGNTRVDSILDEIISSEGSIKFNSGSGVLRGLTFPNGDRIGFSYDNSAGPWLLTGVTREDGKSFGTFEYDDQLRARSTAAFGGVNKYTAEHSDDLSRGPGYSSVKVTSPNGGLTTTILKTSIIQGELIRLPHGTDQAGGSGCAASSSSISYNDVGNRITSVDFSGRRTCSAYDSSRNLETTRLEGLIDDPLADPALNTCPADLPNYTIPANIPPERAQRKIHTQWHPVWHLKTREAEPKRITTWVYNGQPDPLNNNAVASCAPADALLPDGSKIAVLCKRYEQATADETGNLSFAAAALSTRSWSTTYNQHGQVLTETDPRQKKTCHQYWSDTAFDTDGRGHTLGDLWRTSQMAGASQDCTPANMAAQAHKTTHTHYNKRGQVLRTELPNGGVEEREYHLRGWLTKVKQRASAAATSSQDTQYDYYPTGLLKQVTQADGSWQLYLYDDAHRLTDVSDSLGNNVKYTLDNAGNAKQEDHTDPTGVLVKTISRTFDTLGRLQSQKLGAP